MLRGKRWLGKGVYDEEAALTTDNVLRVERVRFGGRPPRFLDAGEEDAPSSRASQGAQGHKTPRTSAKSPHDLVSRSWPEISRAQAISRCSQPLAYAAVPAPVEPLVSADSAESDGAIR
jgi:hypothetical protein